MKYEEIYDQIKQTLSEKRFKHTEGVVERAIEYANCYGENVEYAKIAAILHDCAKEFTKDESYQLLEKYEIELDEIEKKNFNLIHGKLGAAIAKYQYGASNEVANSIRYHTTGRANMTMLEKIIYLADATEKNRKYDEKYDDSSMEELVDLIKKDIDAGMKYVLKWTINSLVRRDLYIHPNSIEAYNYFLDISIKD